MSRYIPTDLRRLVEERAEEKCEYCLFPKSNTPVKHEIEHILPIQHGGETIYENLALACFKCNRHKGTNVGVFDLETGILTPLFNPRIDIWLEHFSLGENAEVIPLTATARVTIRILRLNDENRIEERLELIEAGLY